MRRRYKIINIDKESTIKEVHIGNSGRMFSIQTFDGIEKYYFKPAESKDKISKPYRAYIQEAAYNIQRIINPTKAVKCNVCNINGTFGAIQEKIEIDKELITARSNKKEYLVKDTLFGFNL